MGWNPISKTNLRNPMIQFYHQRDEYPVCTVAMEVPTKDLLNKIFMTHSDGTLVNVGIAIKSPKDQFVKKIGRDIAKNTMQSVVTTLREIAQEGTRHVWSFVIPEFKVKNRSYFISFDLTTVAESEQVRLIRAYVE